MSLKPPVPGLRPIWHNANSAKRVELVVPANAVLEVDEDVAAQLQRADTHFTEVEPGFVPPPLVDPNAESEAESEPAVEVEAPKKARATSKKK